MADRAHRTGVGRATSWQTPVAVAASAAVALAAFVTVAELGFDFDADPVAGLEWFSQPGQRALLLALVGALGISALVAGTNDLDARARRASSATVASTILAAGWAALPLSLWSGSPVARGAAFAVAALVPVGLAHIVQAVARPAVRSPGQGEAPVLWTTAYLLVGALAAVRALAYDPFVDPRCLVHCRRLDPPLRSEALLQVTDIALTCAAVGAVVLAAGLGVLLIVRTRPVALRLMGSAAVLSGAAEATWALGPEAAVVVGPLSTELPGALVGRLLTHLSVAVLATVLLVRQAGRRRDLQRMAREMVAVTPPSRVREILAARLDDESARVEYAAGDGLWVDEDGRPGSSGVDAGGPDRLVVVVAREGRPVARIHATSPEVRPEDLEEALGPAARLALEAERTRAEQLMSLHALRKLRRRVVEESDAARRRAERDLHDGAQHLLLAATFAIQEGLQDTQEGRQPETRQCLERALAQVSGIAADLRSVAHGMYPVLLGDAGLVPALEGLARSSGGPTTVDADPVGRLHPSTELTLYAACALAARSADRAALAISLGIVGTTLRLHLTGAHLPQPQMEPLRDRVAALGGTMETMTGSVLVEVPCA